MCVCLLTFWLCCVSVVACGLSVVEASRGLLLAVGHGLLIAVASLAAEDGLQSRVSVVAARGFSCSKACGIITHQGSNLCAVNWQANF